MDSYRLQNWIQTNYNNNLLLWKSISISNANNSNVQFHIRCFRNVYWHYRQLIVAMEMALAGTCWRFAENSSQQPPNADALPISMKYAYCFNRDAYTQKVHCHFHHGKCFDCVRLVGDMVSAINNMTTLCSYAYDSIYLVVHTTLECKKKCARLESTTVERTYTLCSKLIIVHDKYGYYILCRSHVCFHA